MDLDFKDLKAFQAILETLREFEPHEQSRILRWTIEKLELDVTAPGARHRVDSGLADSLQDQGTTKSRPEDFDSPAALVAAALPRTDAERALVVATYLQFSQEKGDLTGFEINDVLRHLGHGAKNITDAITRLKNRKPALMLQTRKSGKSKQSRKVYRVTAAGYDAVAQMMDQGHGDEESE